MVETSVVAFLAVAAIFIFLNRKKIEVQFPIFMLKDKRLGQGLFSASRKWAGLVKPLSDVGILVAFAGMIYTFFFLAKGALDLFTKEQAGAQVMVIIPGVNFSFWYGIIAIAVLALVHEMSHAIVASAHGMKPKSVAFVLFLFIPGAGVELDEKRMYGKPLRERLRVYSAGSFANVLAAVLFLGLAFPLAQAASGFVHPGDGIRVVEVEPGTPAYGVLQAGDVIASIDGKSVANLTDFRAVTSGLKPNQTIEIAMSSNNGTPVKITAMAATRNKSLLQSIIQFFRPAEASEEPVKGRIGIKTVPDSRVDPQGKPLVWLLGLIQTIFMFNLGVGAMNLLPVPFLDGGRMFADTVEKYQPKRPWIAHSVFALSVLLLLANLLIPIIKGV